MHNFAIFGLSIREGGQGGKLDLFRIYEWEIKIWAKLEPITSEDVEFQPALGCYFRNRTETLSVACILV